MDNLLHLAQAYLYDGWDEYEYDTWHDAVDDFARRSPARVPRAIDEIDAALASDRSDRELAVLLNASKLPYDHEHGASDWLRDLRAHLVTIRGHHP